MNVVLFDDPVIRVNLLPFTYTRPTAGIRTGILTIAEKWAKHLNASVSFLTEGYLAPKFPLITTSDNLFIQGAVCPDAELVKAITSLRSGEALTSQGLLIAARTGGTTVPETSAVRSVEWKSPVVVIDQTWKIFTQNGQQIRIDFDLITRGRKSMTISDPYTRTYSPDQIFVEEGAEITDATLNATNGPIYIGKNAQVMEGSVIRGPFSLGEQSVVNMAAKVRGDTTIGPVCKVGGEISNAVVFGYSNKGHDGFLGSSVLGEWCNLGADTNTSNMKNNYDEVKLWNYGKQGFAGTGLTFCGLMMGDHSKCGINTMFNTGTVVGVSANVFGSGYPRNFIPSFAWGGAGGYMTFQIRKALETAERAMARRNQELTQADREMLQTIFRQTAAERNWEKA